eukprot:TRINITY_DN5172_c0_g1_i1.p1 TRINITY_DN5172_c0_g1~~TRINITY_DN5172_c0_g1_i1.p1  ORF type:complete len:186 (+),score=36.77 TRINITY_DN5172_c0_g1_i1:61-558(+)
MCIRDSTQTIVLIKKNREKMMMTVVLRRFAKEFDTHHGLFRRFSQAMSNDRSSVCNTCKAVNSPTILSCIKCKMLQSPPDTLHKVNFFTLFGISPAFELDVKDLERKYHSLQKSYHPDKVDPRSEDVSAVPRLKLDSLKKIHTYIRVCIILGDSQIQQHAQFDYQ